ncbi:hypothetical protein AX16_000037 [Volvariella volvacea WC 439]|nr:hypothetical protein AX16_000037 [Volvariella volvacea WC 439]
MRLRWCSIVPLAAILFLSALHLTSASPDPYSLNPVGDTSLLLRRNGHGHHNSHAGPLLELNETEILMHHAPTPPSYYTIDWEDSQSSETRHPGLIITHALFMILAFFVALPVGIALRSVRHGAHSVAVATFYGLVILGLGASGLYTKLTPNMYEGSRHGPQGYLVLLFAIILTALDALALFTRILYFVRSSKKFQWRAFWSTVVLNRDDTVQAKSSEYVELATGLDEDEFEETKQSALPRHHSRRSTQDSSEAYWANEEHRHHRHFSQSAASDGTLFAPHSPPSSDRTLPTEHPAHPDPQLSRKHFIRRLGSVAFAVAERSLVFAGLHQLLTGIVVYTGGCRENYINGCLAHLIKGSIFWCYGLLTFARFLGSFAEFGWAWNRPPTSVNYTAEFVESFVIFLYGATNMWMERFGAKPGDPFTTKQIQHISIAVMFCFAGLVGMGIESKKIRRWLASSTFATLASPKLSAETVAEPPSYAGSFNPFPALVIGVTGAAMAAHHQEYLFEVQIHMLWGNLLVAFAVLRCFTYFFLWLGPPRSILPSRPPTEALGSFFLACGGLVFIFSTEEISIAAMRRGRDDVMMFLNVAVAITCLAFCWTLFVVAFKGWLKSRQHPKVTYHSSA